jgi:hypothetical protein
MKASELPWAVKIAAGMQTILAVSITVKFLLLVLGLYQTPGGGFALPGRFFVPLAAFFFTPPIVMSWLSTYRMWIGKESGWILGIASCIICALAFFILAKSLILIPILCLIVFLVPAVIDFYYDKDDCSE